MNAPNPSTAVATTPMDSFRHSLDGMKKEFAAALPQQIPVERFIRTAITAVNLNRDLLNADRTSLIACCMKSAQDGLLLDGREAAAVIFNTKMKDKDGKEKWVKLAQYMPMKAGLLKKMRNTGQLASISTYVVREKDTFTYVLGDDERIEHKPFMDGDAGNLKYVYAIARMKDGTVVRRVMSKTQVDKRRAVSKSKDNGPWVSWYDEMAEKTVLRSIAGLLPSSAEVEKLIENDDDNYDPNMVNVTPSDAPPSALDQITAQIAEEKAKETPPHDPETGEIIENGKPEDKHLEWLRQNARDAALSGGQSLADHLKGLLKVDRDKLLPFKEELEKIAQEIEMASTERGTAQ